MIEKSDVRELVESLLGGLEQSVKQKAPKEKVMATRSEVINSRTDNRDILGPGEVKRYIVQCTETMKQGGYLPK